MKGHLARLKGLTIMIGVAHVASTLAVGEKRNPENDERNAMTDQNETTVNRVEVAETCPTCGQALLREYLEFTTEQDGFALTARVRQEYDVGKPVEAKVRLSNHTDQPLTWGEINGWREFRLQLTSTLGPVPMTEFGQKVLPEPVIDVGRVKGHTLEPGQTQEWVLDLHQVYRLWPTNFKFSLFRYFFHPASPGPGDYKELHLTEIPIRVVLPDERGGGSRTQ